MGLDLNYLDGQTPLDEEEKEGLKIKTISTRGELDEFEQLGVEKANEWLLGRKLKVEKILSEGFVKNCIKKCSMIFGNGLENLGKLTKTLGSIGQ